MTRCISVLALSFVLVACDGSGDTQTATGNPSALPGTTTPVVTPPVQPPPTAPPPVVPPVQPPPTAPPPTAPPPVVSAPVVSPPVQPLPVMLPAIVHENLFLDTAAQVGDLVGTLRLQPAVSGTTNWEIRSGNSDNLFRIENDGRLLIARQPAEIAPSLPAGYDLEVRVSFGGTEAVAQVMVQIFMLLSSTSSGAIFNFDVEPNRAVSFVAEQFNCSAVGGICCAMDVAAPHDYLDFTTLVAVSVDNHLIRYALPPLPSRSSVRLTLKATDGQVCMVQAPRMVLAATSADAARTITAPGALGAQTDLGVIRLGQREYLLDVSRRGRGLTPTAAILTQNYLRNTANIPNPFSSLHYAPVGQSDEFLVTAVDAHKHSQIVLDYLKDTLELDSYDNQGSPMVALTDVDFPGTDLSLDNCGRPLDIAVGSSFNALFNGESIGFTPIVGNRASRAFSAALDVVAHEWGHGVSDALIGSPGLNYERESGALSESYSDWLGAAVEQSFKSTPPDWISGEDAIEGGIRSLKTPTTFQQPDTYMGRLWDETSDDPALTCEFFCNDNCGVHTNSGVGNKMFYLLAAGGTHNDVTVSGIGTDKAIRIATHAVENFWTRNTNYRLARTTMIMAAAAIYGAGSVEQTQVQLAWDAVRVSG